MSAASMAALWWADRLEKGDKVKFVETLTKLIDHELHTAAGICRELKNRHGVDREPDCTLRCDYDPQGILLDAVHAAGIECRGSMFSADGVLPRKHVLHVYRDRLKPKEGWELAADVVTAVVAAAAARISVGGMPPLLWRASAM